jgi:predicted TPR repeat methyltransferase
MDEATNLFMDGQFASRYDDLIQTQNWYGPEILLGMIFEYIKSGEKILDIGIGTGLSATAFHNVAWRAQRHSTIVHTVPRIHLIACAL